MNIITKTYLSAYYQNTRTLVFRDVQGKRIDNHRRHYITEQCLECLQEREGMSLDRAQKTMLMIGKYAVRSAVEWLEPIIEDKKRLTWWRGF